MTKETSTISDNIVSSLSNENDTSVSSPISNELTSPILTEQTPPNSSHSALSIQSAAFLPPSASCSLPDTSDLSESAENVSDQSTSSEDECNSAQEPTNIVTQQIRKIQRIFVKYPQMSRTCKDELLQCMKELAQETQEALPKSSRSLRLKPIKHSTYYVPPGRVCYFGIKRVLNTSVVKLFNPRKTTVNLILNIDGVPLF